MTKAQRLPLLIAGVAILSLVGTYVALAAVLGDNLENISRTSGDAGYPAIAVSGDNVGIVWSQRYIPAGTALQGPVYLKGSTDGANLKIKQTVDDSNSEADQSLTPDVASDPTNLARTHIVWKNIQGTTQRIYYTRCTIGASCTSHEEVRLPGGSTLIDFPKVSGNASAVPGVHVVWQEGSGNNKQIFYRGRKNDGSWTGAMAISDAPANLSRPAIAVSNDGSNYVHVVWANNSSTPPRIEYKRGSVIGDGTVSTFGDFESFNTPTSGADEADDVGYPAVAAIGQSVVVLWDAHKKGTSPAQYFALYRASTNNGDTFGTLREVGTDNTSGFTGRLSIRELADYSQRLQIDAVFEPGTAPILHVVWHQTVSPEVGVNIHDVFYSSRPFGSGSDAWSAVSNETQNKKFYGDSGNQHYLYSMSPAIGVGPSGRLHVVYMEGRDMNEYEVDQTTLNIIYNGTQPLVDNNPRTYLPLVLKRAS